MIPKRRSKRKARWEAVQSVLFVVLFVILVGGVVVFFVYSNFNLNNRRAELQERKAELQTQLLELQLQQLDLEAKIEYNGSEESQEQILREQGLFKKPGEEVITILPSEEVEEVESVAKERVWWNPISWF